MSNLINLPDRVTVLRCNACDSGTFAPTTLDASTWECDECGNLIYAPHDIAPHLEPGEILTSVFIAVGEVRLAWTTRRTSTCHTCGTTNGHHFSVRIGDDMPSTLIPCPNESE